MEEWKYIKNLKAKNPVLKMFGYANLVKTRIEVMVLQYATL